MSSIVSVVIPTRERAETLRHALQTVVEQTYGGLEIIVSDNASSAATRDTVEGFGDPRIRYVNTGRRVSMSENFEFALAHVTGDWIAVIGDDDGILPSGIERGMNALLATATQALGSNLAHYRWPIPGGSGPEMYLTVPARRGHEIRYTKTQMRRMLRGELHYTTSPMLYTGGIVSASLFRRIKARSGNFYRSQIPDVYSAFAVCSAIENFVFMHEPVFVGGNSTHSTGANFVNSPGSIFQQENVIPLHEGLVLNPGESTHLILPTLVYESHLQSRFLRSEPDIVKPAEQLRLAQLVGSGLAKQNPVWTPFLSEWSMRFAKYHMLPTARQRTGFREAARRILHSNKIRFRNLFGSYRVDRALGLPYANVREAAQVSERFVRNHFSLAANLAHSVARKFGWL